MLKLLQSQFDFKSDFLFNGLTKEEENQVKSLFEPINFKKGSQLFYEDGVPTGVFLIENGLTKKFKTVIGEQEQIFYIYSNGDLLGYHALLSKERYQDSCEAVEDTSTNFLSKENFQKVLESFPVVKDNLIRNLAHEFGVLANTIGILAQKTQSVRLAVFLLILEGRYKKFDGLANGIRLSRLDLANLIAATRESLGRSLKEFKDKGIISIESKAIRITNYKELFKMLENEEIASKEIMSDLT
ncbi:MAG: Crp/Fnr family transcriptional regulator [Cyclobacteriaceae bacterium]